MQNRPFTYLFWVQYLGYRYHGWQKQEGLKTIQGKIEKSAKFLLGHEDFMILGASRTDAGVSCNRGAFELFTVDSLDLELFEAELNRALPDDIRIIGSQTVPLDFNIIQDVVAKEYHYFFVSGKKFHPFAAAHLTYIKHELDIELMKVALKLFLGKHDFRRFCTQNKLAKNFVREIFEAELTPATTYQGYYFPQDIYLFRVKGSGFLTHQVRVMMGALLEVGQGKIGVSDIGIALLSDEISPLSHKAPSQGLVLGEVWFDSKQIK